MASNDKKKRGVGGTLDELLEQISGVGFRTGRKGGPVSRRDKDNGLKESLVKRLGRVTASRDTFMLCPTHNIRFPKGATCPACGFGVKLKVHARKTL